MREEKLDVFSNDQVVFLFSSSHCERIHKTPNWQSLGIIFETRKIKTTKYIQQPQKLSALAGCEWKSIKRRNKEEKEETKRKRRTYTRVTAAAMHEDKCKNTNSGPHKKEVDMQIFDCLTSAKYPALHKKKL